jgi:uncharacterized protein (TIGR02145 family)
MKLFRYFLALFSVLTVFMFSTCDEDEPDSDLGRAVYDKSGNQYSTIKIGDQVWLKENLRTTLYNNGDPISTTANASTDISAEGSPKYWWIYFDGSDPVGTSVGRLYTWHALNDARGVCPPGFRVPVEDDWIELANFLGGNLFAGGKLKLEGTGIWNAPNLGATNEVNFDALPGGFRQPDGTYVGYGTSALFWTSTSSTVDTAIGFTLSNQNTVLGTATQDKKYGASCRCIEN